MPTINPVQSALAAAHTQAAQKATELNTTAAPKTGTTVVKTAAPQDQVTISSTARQAQTQSQLQAQQAKPSIASGNDSEATESK
jgi:hypothetical protein